MKIVTEYVNPPIPDRSFDWSATLDSYEPGDPIGRGETEAEAIADLEAALFDAAEMRIGREDYERDLCAAVAREARS